MARADKVAVVEAVRDELSGSAATLFTEYRGLTVGQLARLRRELRDANARYVVVKNTLALIAARDAGYDGLDEVLVGPTALAFCDDDPVGPAKAIRRFAREYPALVVKGAILEGRLIDAAQAGQLADLESRDELLARLAGLMHGALARTAGMLQAPLAQMARLMAALQDKSPAAASEPEPPAPEPEPESEPESEPAPTEPTA